MAGLELLFTSVQAQLQGGEDAVMCSLHWSVIHQGLQCIGVGDQPPDSLSSCKRSELLPAGWNTSRDAYNLLYTDTGGTRCYVLKVIRMENSLLVHFMRFGEDSMSDMMVDVPQYTNTDISSYHSAYRDIEGLQKRFEKEVLKPVLTPTHPSTGASTSQQRPSGREMDPLRDERDPLRVPPRRPHAQQPPEWGEPANPFPSIGRGDLDPLAGGMGGGMMFDPMRSRPHRGIDPSAGLPGRLPPGAVPPGARFDPFGPDIDISGNPRGGRAGPDPDHLPPPGFDDMFM